MPAHAENAVSGIDLTISATQDESALKELRAKADAVYQTGSLESGKQYYRQYVELHCAQGRGPIPHYITSRAGIQSYIFKTCKQSKLAYLPIPKCACTSMLKLLYSITHNRPCPDNIKIHGYYRHGSSRLDISSLHDYYKFTVVRDPIARFVSGYRNRIIHHQDLDRRMQSGTPVPDINEFVSRLEEFSYRCRSVYNHFAPQGSRLQRNLAIFDQVVPIEQLDVFVENLGERLQQPLTLTREQTGGPTMSVDDLSAASLKKLLEYYQDDYVLLKDYYSPEKYLAK